MSKPVFIMMVGLPESGKSEISNLLSLKYDATIHSSDHLRLEICRDKGDQNDNANLFKELQKRIKYDLSNKKSVIYNACNINFNSRKTFLKEIEKYNPLKICWVVSRSYDDCLKSNLKRGNKVPVDAIKRMLLNFWVPQYYEGWDEIKIEYTGNSMPENLQDSLRYCNDNGHHTLTLGEHMKAVGRYLVEKYNISTMSDLFVAAQWHDIGKLFTKTYVSKKGSVDTNAHYYSHHNVGAYEFLSLASALGICSASEKGTKSVLNICNFIQWHMRPYDIEKNGGEEKFVNLVGQKFYDELMILHEANKVVR